MSTTSDRKRDVDRLLKSIEKYPAASYFKQEMMVFAYVLVCGSVEFMVENIVQDWLNKTIKHHRVSKRYYGRQYVQSFLDSQSLARERNIIDFHSTKLSEIKRLICTVAGEKAKKRFNILFDATLNLSITLSVDARLERINRFRHELAHGQKMPNETQPNISELREDFSLIYKYIIKNIQKCLPQV